ncbi:MAG: YwmB family TATA-box binding protein [Christensenellaceae bacterium]|jgi:hypothetical protein
MAFGIKQFFSAAAALLASLFIGLTVCLMNVSAFSGGRSTYYLYSPSSQAEISETLELCDLAALSGESVVYLDVGAKGSLTEEGKGLSAEGKEIAEKIIKRYRAKLCFAEEISETVSYYCYSPMLKGGVVLRGKKINFHIAVRTESIVLGTPIIFGGY